jgi:hypothetical protein
MPYTISGETAAGPVTVTKKDAAEALVLWRQYNAAGLHPITAKNHRGEGVTLEQLMALAELEGSHGNGPGQRSAPPA